MEFRIGVIGDVLLIVGSVCVMDPVGLDTAVKGVSVGTKSCVMMLGLPVDGVLLCNVEAEVRDVIPAATIAARSAFARSVAALAASWVALLAETSFGSTAAAIVSISLVKSFLLRVLFRTINFCCHRITTSFRADTFC